MKENGRLIFCGSLVLILAQAFIAHSQEVSQNQQMVYLSIAPIPSVPRNPETGKPPVFDNDLLDRLFGKDRVTQQESKRDQSGSESDVNNQSDRNGSDRAFNNQGLDENIFPKPRTELSLVRPNESFSEKITARTPSNQAAALRFAEQGRRHLAERQYKRALDCFEKAMAVGLYRYLPYVYYYLARTHHYLTNYQYSLNFLEVAESSLSGQPEWMSMIAAVKDQNFGGRSAHVSAQVR